MKISFTDYATGAAMATDLVNTSAEVRRSTGEALPDSKALEAFLATHRIQPEAPRTKRDLDAVHELRNELRTLIGYSIGQATDDAAVDGASALVTRAGLGPVLRRDPEGHWQWYVATAHGASLADELAVLAGVGLLGVLRSLSRERFRHCASPVCNGMFVDTSKAGRRRYCMPELCGNRLNVANHRARRRGETDGGLA